MSRILPQPVRTHLARVPEIMPDAFIVLDREWRFVYVNPRAARLLRRDRDAPSSDTIWDTLPELAGSRLERELRTAAAQDSPVTFEDYDPLLDGWFSVRIYPASDAVAVYLQDITERKRAEEALRLSEAKFAGIVSIASDAIIAVDESQKIVLFNIGAETIFGYTAEEAVGQPLDLLIPERSRREHREHVAEFSDSAVSARRMGERGEVTGRRKNGETFPAEASISKLDISGKRIFTAVLRDVSERKRAEDELRLLQSLTLAITAASDLPAALTVALEQVCRIVGWSYGEIWLPSADGRRLELAPSFYTADPQLTAFHEASRTFSFALDEGLPGQIWSRGEPAWIHDITVEPGYMRGELAAWAGLRTAVAIPALAEGRVVAILVLYNAGAGEEDARLIRLVSAAAAQLGVVIREKRVLEALARQAEVLARSNAELEQFASVASHDLQEPLRKIMAFGDRLLTKHSDSLAEEATDYLRRMQDASLRMQELIQDLLIFSRLTTKAQPFERIALRRVADDVISDLETSLEEAGGRIEIGDLPELEADPLQMRQLFQNLIANAIKFHAPDSPPRVRIHGRLVPEGETGFDDTAAAVDLYEIFVEDDGIGFDERYLDRIFGVFQRLHGRGRYPGTGMGLAICRKIAERHGGTITARSSPGAGATFVVALPATQVSAKEMDA